MAQLDEAALLSVTKTIADYRAGESVSARSPEIVRAWLAQFPDNAQGPILKAIDYALARTYISRTNFKEFLTGLAGSQKITGASEPADYWREANFLRIQKGGNSQNELLAMFDTVLQETYGYGLTDTGSDGGDFIYLDDCIGTGSRVRTDVCDWVEADAPQSSRLHVISPILYKGAYWIDEKIQEAASANGKKIEMHKWRIPSFYLENRRTYRNAADTLWPTIIPESPEAQAYAAALQAKGRPATLRAAGNAGAAGIFENDAQKILLEQAFLMRGCQIRQECTNLPESFRPLGFQNLDTLGFGSMCVTFRNCPNNCPLVFWVEQGAYPALFPRKTNTQTLEDNFLAQFF